LIAAGYIQVRVPDVGMDHATYSRTDPRPAVVPGAQNEAETSIASSDLTAEVGTERVHQ
jgi:hypothetical protein